MQARPQRISTQVCVVGGGPAGLMLGLLLARSGVPVVVLEKHPDFLRDFRGDTVHPSTITLLDRLGLSERFLTLPHRKVSRLRASVGPDTYQLVDFTTLPGPHRYLALLPQWDFLNFLADEAARYPTFTLLRSAEVTDLVEDAGRVRGVRATTPDGPLEVTAELTVACDGRDSAVRRLVGVAPQEFGAPMDVLWFRLTRGSRDGDGMLMRIGRGRLMVEFDRGGYWQIAYVIPKGSHQRVMATGLPGFRAAVADLHPALADRVDTITGWDQVKALTVQINRLRRWHAPGVLLIGDAAHAMSPIGGVGVNLAIQDAVATARLLAGPLRRGTVTDADLARIRRRRWLPTAGTQLAQRAVGRMLVRVLNEVDGPGPVRAPLPMRIAGRFRPLQRRTARMIGIGLRPEYQAPAEAPMAESSG